LESRHDQKFNLHDGAGDAAENYGQKTAVILTVVPILEGLEGCKDVQVVGQLIVGVNDRAW